MPYEYIAFISYNRKDTKWASKLQRKIEYYKLPSIILKDIPASLLHAYPDLPKKMPRTFRDMTELEPGQDLSEALKKALKDSQYLIVICSPNSSKSEWVNKEIEYFIELGKQNAIIPIIIDGNVHSSDVEKECYPPALLKLCEKVEIVGTDVRDIGGFNASCIKIIARILNIRFEQLWRRYERHMRAKHMSIVCFGVISVLISIGVMWLYIDRNSAYSQLSDTYATLERTMADLNRSNTDLKLAYDSIVSANDIIHQKTDSLIKSRLEIQNESDQRKTAQLLREQQSLMTAIYNSEALLNSGNALEAAEVALKQLKSSSQYNYSPKLEYSLRMALDILESDSMKLIKRYTPSVTFVGYSSREDQDIIFIEDGKYFFSYSAELNIFETITGDLVGWNENGADIAGYDATSKTITGWNHGKLFRFHWPTHSYNSKKIESTRYRNYDGVSRDGKRVFTDTPRGGETIWDAEKMETITENISVGFMGKIEDGVSYDGKKFVILYNDNKAYEVDIESKDKRFIDSDVTDIQYATDGETIITTHDNFICVFNENHKISSTIIGDFNRVFKFAISGNKRYLAANNTIYDLVTELPVDRYDGEIMKMWFSYDGSTLYTYSNDYVLSIWHRNPDPLYKSISLSPAPFLLEGFGIYSTQDGSLWTIEKEPKYMGERNATFENWDKRYNQDHTIYADISNPITIYDVKSGKEIGEPIKINTNAINHVSFSPDNRLIAVTAYNLRTTIYDIQSGEPIQVLPFTGEGFLVGMCDFGKDGRLYVGPPFQANSQDKLLWRDFHPYPAILNHAETIIKNKRKALQD